MQINISRRNLLKLGLYSAVGMNLTHLSMLSGCATLALEAYKEPTPAHYPKLPGKKIQSPEHYGLEGCYVGGWRLNNKYYYSKTNKILSISYVDSIYAMKDLHARFREVKGLDENAALEEATIPFVHYDLDYWVRSTGLNGILNGKWDNIIKTHAENARKIGEEQGGFFIRILRELNIKYGKWPPWKNQSDKCKKTFRYIWHIFNEEGANEFATWVFNPYSTNNNWTEPWQWSYPGDEYVDWFGLNGYNYYGQTNNPYMTFISLFTKDYNYLRRYLPNKPIIIAETGMDESKSKPKWVKDAFHNLKNDFPGIKAVMWWNELWSYNTVRNFDSRINSSDASLQAFVEGVSDPYFLGAVPYLGDTNN